MTTTRLVEAEPPTALEFFSGIGAFSLAAKFRGIKVLRSYDQSQAANEIFAANFSCAPCTRNLDSIKAADLPAADIWWMSPPCTPYTMRGKRADAADPRALSLHNLIALIPHLVPQSILVENVIGFIDSQMRAKLMKALEDNDYCAVSTNICSTDLGVPMKRPRHFIIAIKNGGPGNLNTLQENLNICRNGKHPSRLSLTDFLDDQISEELYLPAALAQKYHSGLNVINFNDSAATAICFTSGYWTCHKSSGSYIRDIQGRLRRFSSKEMLQLFGFTANFDFPAQMPEKTRSRLIGNSVDVRVVRLLLESLGL